MPKLKTHKATARRFKVTATGKLMRTRHGKSHLRRKKAPRVQRAFQQMVPVSKADQQRVRRLIPYAR
ncbi:MAG TPA: 50S ribosomal protein L35 [Chloroflexota bacterium]|jgi:large subunit ribosomal protein L35